MVSYSDFETVIIILIMGVVGIICAMILNVLYTQGIVVDEFITGSISLVDLQALVIVFWLFIGVLIAAVKK